MDGASVRCAPAFRALDADPIGTATTCSGFLLVEWPLPWPSDIGEIDDLVAVEAMCRLRGLRLQLLVPNDGGDVRRVARYSPAGSFAGYACASRRVAAGDVVDAAVSLAAGGSGDVGQDPGVDVLVCGHGRRDVCCGSAGTALARRLAELNLPGTTVWRTSHTGGHRFAPTALVLPHATMWAFVDEQLISDVVHRGGDLASVLGRYRGSAALPAPAQVVEREALREIGWAWFDWRRDASVLDDGWVRLAATSPVGESRVWEGRVEVRRKLPVPVCGMPLDDATKTTPEYALVDLR